MEGITDRPSQLSVIKVWKTKLLIEWVPGIHVGTYQIFGLKYTMNEGIEWTSVEINQKKMSSDPKNITLTGLTECQIYTLYMYAENDVGKSYTTENITASTDCSGQPVKPQHLRVIQIFETKCLIAWIQGSRTNETFIIKFVKKDHSKWHLLKINQTDTNNVIKTFELTNLKGCEIYTIQMFSENYNGESQPTENITVTTDCPHTSENEENITVTTDCSHTSENEDTQENNLLLAIPIVLIVLAVILVFIVYNKCVNKKGYDTSTEKSGDILLGFNDMKDNHGQEEQEKLLGTKGGTSCSVSISKPGDENSEHMGTADEKDEISLSKTANSQEKDTRDQLNETCDQALENQSCSSDNM